MSAPVLEDGVVRLRPLAERDVAAYIASFDEDTDLANLLGWEDVPAADWLLERPQNEWIDPPETRSYEWVVADAASDTFAGALALHSLAWHHRRAETGFWIAPSWRRLGYLSRALALVLDWCFANGIERMELTALPENEVVPVIAERFGYTYEGTLRKRNFERGRRVDLLIWGLLADEHQARGSTPR
jgi:ribosomal-protein-alanine N-acetyltransferase